MNLAIVLFQWKDGFFRLLRKFTNDPYDAFGIIYDDYFLVMNIYNGRKPNWWNEREVSFEEFKANPRIESCYYISIDVKDLGIRGKMMLSSTISQFSGRKKTLEQFLKNCLIDRQEFSGRIGIQFLKSFLKGINRWRGDILDNGKLIVQSSADNIQVERDIQTLVEVIKKLIDHSEKPFEEEDVNTKFRKYINISGDGIENLSTEALLEIRRQIDSEENFSSEWLTLSSKINDELSKR
jgi:hypothetical protein